MGCGNGERGDGKTGYLEETMAEERLQGTPLSNWSSRPGRV